MTRKCESIKIKEEETFHPFDLDHWLRVNKTQFEGGIFRFYNQILTGSKLQNTCMQVNSRKRRRRNELSTKLLICVSK